LIEIAFILFGFLLGSLPFSVWLGRFKLHGEDIRAYGDGNPGATTTWRAAGWQLGLLVLLLDITKGALPVGLAHQVFGIDGFAMWCIALSPTLGHAFSPFLRGHGGKALAVTLGVWIGLSLYTVSIPMVIFLVIWYAIISIDGWAVLFTTITAFLYLVIFFPDILYLATLAGDILIFVYKQKEDLSKPPRLRPWITRMLRR
jgi:acyl phosphate:glycerol-3-phosphate acyltransferase